jgi:hypothetical protein
MVIYMKHFVAMLLAAVCICGTSLGQDSAPPDAMTRLVINSGTLYTRSGVPLHLAHAVALVAKGMQPIPGDGKAVVVLNSGQVSVTSDSLGKLMRTKLQGKGIEDLSITTDANKVKISGKMKKIVKVPITIEGPLDVTPDGKIELRTTSMKTAKLPIKGLADALGMNVSHIVGNNANGVKSEGDTLIFDPDELWGLPVHGHLVKAVVQSNGLLLVFGAPPPPAGRHMAAAR